MRQLSPDVVTYLNTQYGTEPVSVVKVYWSETDIVNYGDKADPLNFVEGKLLELSPIDDIVTLNGSGSSRSITFTLDDTDGTLLERLNNKDVYQTKVDVYQSFAGMSLASAVRMFTGFINTPVDWSEGERKATFTVISRLDDAEFGAEMGVAGVKLHEFYDRLEGITLPFIVGNVYRYPGTAFSMPPRGVILKGFAYVNKELYDAEIIAIGQEQQKAIQQAGFCYNGGVLADLRRAEAEAAGDTEGAQGYQQEREQWYQQYVQYSNEVVQLGIDQTTLRVDYEEKKKYSYESQPVQIYVDSIRKDTPAQNATPQEIELLYRVEIGGDQYVATYSYNFLNITRPASQDYKAGTAFVSQVYDKTVTRITESRANAQRFKWYDAGTQFRDVTGKIKYFFGLNCQVQRVYGKSRGVKVALPNGMWTPKTFDIKNNQDEVVANLAGIEVPVLTSILNPAGEPVFDGDEVWADLKGNADTLGEVIEAAVAYSANLEIDEATFISEVGPYNGRTLSGVFAGQTGVLDFIRDVCYQNRIAVWIDGNTLKFRDMSKKPTPVDVITPADVEEKTLVMGMTNTDGLVTKYTGLYRPRWDAEQPNQISFRYNVLKYGLREKSYNFWLFGNPEAVFQSAGFWCVYEGTCWKTLTMRVGGNKLGLETNDAVSLENFNGLFSRDNVVGIVTSAVYNSDSHSVDLSIWLPIRAGEMTEFEFAYPAQADKVAFDKYTGDFLSGNPFFETRIPPLTAPFTYVPSFTRYDLAIPFYGQHLGNAVPQVDPVGTGVFDQARPPGLKTINDKDQKKVLPATIPESNGTKDGTTRAGRVVKHLEANKYEFEYGPDRIMTVYQMQIAEGEIIPNGTYTFATKQGGFWFIQVPIWLTEPPEEDV